jgi:hypothetical protein
MENRNSPRFSTSVPIGLRFPRGRRREGWGRIVNINASGLLLETRFPVRVADVLYVSFVLKDGAKFENLRARVIRSQYEEGYYAAGIAFDEVVDHETLRDVLASLLYEGGVPYEGIRS